MALLKTHVLREEQLTHGVISPSPLLQGKSCKEAKRGRMHGAWHSFSGTEQL